MSSAEETNGKGQHETADERTALLQTSTTSQSYTTQQTEVHYHQEQHHEEEEEQQILATVMDVEVGVANNMVERQEEPMVSEVLMAKTVKKVIRQHNQARDYMTQQQQQQQTSASASNGGKHADVHILPVRPPAALMYRRGSNTSSSSSSSSNTSSSSDDEDEQRVPQQRGMRKRAQIQAALQSATENWKERHGWSSAAFLDGSSNHRVDSSEEPLPPLPAASLSLPPVEADIYRVTGIASVCTLLAMAKTKNDARTQRLALLTLRYSVKNSAFSRPMILREVLLKPHLKGRCALDWAVENECHVFLADSLVQAVMHDAWWMYGAAQDWNEHKPEEHPYAVWKPFRWMPDYLARWASARYQGMAALACGLVYLALHLATLANTDFQGSDHVHPFEYAFYVFVGSDALLFSLSTLAHPCVASRNPATYLELTAVGLLVSSLVLRFVALLGVSSLEQQASLLYWAYALLAWATPLMIFRVVLWHQDLCWTVYKVRFLVGRCVSEALWAIGLGVCALVAFWIGLAALQRYDVDVWTMLLNLALGALHAPAIAGTLYFQPVAAGIMLFVYLVVMVVLVGSLVVASVIATLIAEYPHLDDTHNKFLARRAARAPNFGAYIANFVIELIVGAIRWILVNVFKLDPKSSSCVLWLERIRQVLWFIVFLPLIVIVAIVEGVVFLYKRIRSACSSGYHQID